MKSPTVEQKLLAYGRPMVTLKELAAAMGLEYMGLYQRFRNHPQIKQPPSMRIGGAQMVITDSAILWHRQHVKEWEAIQTARRAA